MIMSLNTGLKYQGGVPINAERLNTSSLNRIRDKSCVLALDFNNDTSDRSSRGNNGINYGGTFTSGKRGISLNLDGASNYVDCGNASNLNMVNELTIMAWVNISDFTDNVGVVSKWATASTKQYLFAIASNEKPTLYLSVDGTAVGAGTSCNTALNIGEWNHIAVTFKRPTYTYYIDGIAKNSATWNYAIGSTTSNVRIGRYLNAFWFKDFIDEVRIYNRALDQREIYVLYRGFN